MTQEPTRPVVLQGGRLCGLPNQRVKTRLDATEYVDDDDGRVYEYKKHHVSDEGVDVFRIVKVRPPVPKEEITQDDLGELVEQGEKLIEEPKKKPKKKSSKPRGEKD